jgi:hypothetical protein
MSKKRDKVVWNIRDILSSTRVEAMTLEEEGAYRRALDKFYLNGWLPYDIKELQKVIGKGCTIKTAKVVRDMFKQSSQFPNQLTHDYLEKLPDGNEQELIDNSFDGDEKTKRFNEFVAGFFYENDLYNMATIKYRLSPDEFKALITEFAQLKTLTHEHLRFTHTSDIRRNFVYWLPYQSVVKSKQNGQPTTVNPKSVTSKLQGW